jgi:hypothetical protein
MTPDVFISHSPLDVSVADEMCAFLEAQDIKCWIAHRDGDAEEDAGEILKGILACRTMVLILSGNAAASDAVRDQVEQAVRAQKVLVPFRIENVPTAGEMDRHLKHRYSIDALAAPLEQHLENLARVLKPLTHKRVPKPAAAQTISGTLPALSFKIRRADVPVLPTKPASDAPVRIHFNFNHIVVAGHSSIFQLKLDNPGPEPVEDIDISVDARCLKKPFLARWSRLAPGQSGFHSFEIEPNRAGYFVLRVVAKCRTGSTVRSFIGVRSVRANEAPTTDLVRTMRKLLGTPEADLPVGARESQSLRDLLHVELPELFEPLDLSSDYEVAAQEEARVYQDAPMQIPSAFLGQVPAASLLRLEPLGMAAALPYQEIRLSARPNFTIGRSREESDLVTWFWPRNEVHDVKTRRISKKHCALAITNEGILVRNITTTGRTMLDGEDVANAEDVPLKGGGVLDLSGTYFLELARFPSALPGGVSISNLNLWPGPRSAEVPPVTGCIRFLPVTPHVLPQISTWLLTDGTFGSSRANPILLELKGFADIQGRFHHRHGVFWIENFVENGAVQIEGKALPPGSIVPLTAGQSVRLGEREFRVALER